MKRSSKIPASQADTDSVVPLNEELKRQVNAELAKPDTSAAVLTDLFTTYIRKLKIPKKEETLRSQAIEFANHLIARKNKYGTEYMQRLFTDTVDGVQHYQELRHYLDPDDNGRVSVREFIQAIAHGKIPTILRALDLNNDGIVTKAEATESLQTAGLKLEGVKGGFDRSASALGRALALAGVQFKAMPQPVDRDRNHPQRPRYVAVVPPAIDSGEKVK